MPPAISRKGDTHEACFDNVCGIGLMLPPLAAIESGSPARAAEVPAYFKPIVGTETSTAAEIGTKNVLQLLKKNIAWAAQTQVGHWMNVIAGWKQMLGADWDKTYAARNTIYVARQNNILFSVLAQFF